MSRIFCYWADPNEPTHCAFCGEKLSYYRWTVNVNGIRRICCTEVHAKNLKYDWDQSHQLGLPLDDEIPHLEQVEKPPKVPIKEPGSLPQEDE